MDQKRASFLSGFLTATFFAVGAVAWAWPRQVPPIHYEHIRDLPHDAGEAVMTALVAEREQRADGQRIMDQPAWTHIIGCPGDAESGPVVFTVKDDGFWSESKAGQYLPVTYFKYPGTDGQPPQYEFRGYAIQEMVPQ